MLSDLNLKSCENKILLVWAFKEVTFKSIKPVRKNKLMNLMHLMLIIKKNNLEKKIIK